MCGFSGFLGPSFDGDWATSILHNMGDKIYHRGPNDGGIWLDNHSGFAMVHRRLSIVDLSPSGHQPMFSTSRRFVVAFNGEIYNHLELRKELRNEKLLPISWSGHSDTETLLACIESWGVDVTLKKCIGMFAFTLWDSEQRRIFLARDRFGEKPLYYGWQGDTFFFWF